MPKEGDGTTPVRIETAIVGILDKEAVQRIRQRQALSGGVFEDITGAMVAQERRKLIRQLVLKTLLPLGDPTPVVIVAECFGPPDEISEVYSWISAEQARLAREMPKGVKAAWEMRWKWREMLDDAEKKKAGP